MNNSLNDLQEYFSFQGSSDIKNDQFDQCLSNKDCSNVNKIDKTDSAINEEMEELYSIEKEIQLKQLQIQSRKEELNMLKAQFSEGKIISGELNDQLEKGYSINILHNDILFKNKLEELKKQENIIKMKELVLETIMIQPNKAENNHLISSSRGSGNHEMNTNFKYERPINKNKDKKKIIYQRNIIEYINKRDLNQMNSKQISNNNNTHNDISNSNNNTNSTNDIYSTPFDKKKLRKNSSECKVNTKLKKIDLLTKGNEKGHSFVCENQQNKLSNIRTCSIDLNLKSNSKISSNNTTIISDIIDENIRNKNKKKKAMIISGFKQSLSIESKDKLINESYVTKGTYCKEEGESKNNISVIIAKLESDKRIDKNIDNNDQSINNSIVVLSRNTSRNEIPKNYSKVVKLNQSREKNKTFNIINPIDSNKSIYGKSLIDEKTKEIINQSIINMKKYKAKKTNRNKSFDNNLHSNNSTINNAVSKRSRNSSIDSKKTSLLSGLLTRILKEEKQRLLMKSCNQAIINEFENSMFLSKDGIDNNSNQKGSKLSISINDIRLKSNDKCDFVKLKIQNINRMINIPLKNNIKTKSNKSGLKDDIDNYIQIPTMLKEVMHVDSNNCHSNKYRKIRVNKSLPRINYPDLDCQEQSNISYVSVGNQSDVIVNKHIENNLIQNESIHRSHLNNDNQSNRNKCNSSRSNCNKNNDYNRSSMKLSSNNSQKVLKDNQDITNANTNISQYSNKTPIKEIKNDLVYPISNYNIGLDTNCSGSKSCSIINNNPQVNINYIQNSAKDIKISKKDSFYSNESLSETKINNKKKSVYAFDNNKLLKHFIIVLKKNCFNAIRKINIFGALKSYAGKTTFYYLLNKYLTKRAYYTHMHRFFYTLKTSNKNPKKVFVKVEELPNDESNENEKVNSKSERDIIYYQNNLNKLKQIAFDIQTYEVIVNEIEFSFKNTLTC